MTKIYKWKTSDKWLYALSMVPFVTVFVGTAWLLSLYSIYLTLTLIGLFLIVNVFQAGCCVGCPYRGHYCPALCGVYLGNLLSVLLYRNRKNEPRLFHINASFGESILFITMLFPVYWVYITGWWYLILYAFLLLTHFTIFMSTQCGKCSYNHTCPGGKFWCGLMSS